MNIRQHQRQKDVQKESGVGVIGFVLAMEGGVTDCIPEESRRGHGFREWSVLDGAFGHVEVRDLHLR